ncbi:site-specific DNA-methyltransferase [Wielerella bovis]|uniref:site-specific DNA-methyltransferase n=1 Tax=Wielerella bovis TaxID=2917790 RepID=UPI0020190FCC|nr:site-specific DNA-methyltransferase [Wielerella bovis]MCG7657763.1 site-specific DNA-methyltransferase [Wielerella bovis]MCG7659985.1 site-specific DNA-methyltransferase [Wielerella bovis]
MPELTWSGKDKVKFHHHDVPFYLLNQQYHFVAEAGKPQNREDNILIHGDNLLALKSLLPEFGGRINCIYIDPPYNTGNENWVYNDNVNDPRIQKWLGEVVGKEGEDFSRHDKWLCMMYPRLKLLKQLLADDGVIFISIDDNEQASLKLICDEIFGYGNLLAQMVWRTDGNFDNQAKIKICHEYILCYAKNINLLGLPNGIDPSISENSKIFNPLIKNTIVKNGSKNPISTITLPIGFPCSEKELIISKRDDAYPHYFNDAIIKNYCLTNPVEVSSGWSSKSLLEEFIEEDFQLVMDTKGQKTRFEISSTGAIESIKERENTSHIVSILQGLGSTQNMSNDLKNANIIFDFPKPVDLIKFLINFYANKNAIILDSFSGSGTTAHAVLSLNKDGGNRRFIGVEMMDYAETITAERIRRVINGYGNKPETQNGTGGGFTFYTIGDPLFIAPDTLNPNASLAAIRQYIGYTENLQQTWQPENGVSPHALGYQNGTAYVFYYEQDEVTTLDLPFLQTLQATGLPEKPECWVIYADKVVLTESQLKTFNIVFKRIPRDISRF